MEELGVTSIDIRKAPIVAERGPDWDQALENYDGSYEMLGRHVGRALVNNLSRKGVVRSVHSLAEQQPPIPSGDAEVFMGAAIMEFDMLSPILERVEV